MPSGVQPQWVDAFGSRPGQQCNGRVWVAVRGTHFAPPVGNPSVFGRLRRSEVAAWGPTLCRRQQAVVLGTKNMLDPGQQPV